MFSEDASVEFDAVGFTAVEDSSISYNFGDVIIFPDIVTNIGNHYNAQTGIFTCPITGMYNIQLTVMSLQYAFAIVNIVHEGTAVGTAYGVNSDYDQGSASVVIVCNAGDEVWAQCDVSSTGLTGSRPYNVFSGFLLYPL